MIKFPFQNPDLPFKDRVEDFVSRMTLEEKISQMVHDAPAIERLGVPKYNWWNECLHGVGRAGLATVFPQAIGMAAAWDAEMMFDIATVISDEARAKHHEYLRQYKHEIYQGLTFWTPNINLFRDPRWGRGMETYGEDPYLTAKLAVPFIKGLQGDNEKYLKLVATAKHYTVHSGPEIDRHTFDAQTSDRDFWESYMPHFEATIKEANVYSIMCAYNRFRGEAACASNFLTNEILRDQWGFDGYVVSDCGAIYDVFAHHKVVNSKPEAAALAVKSGTDLNCGCVYNSLGEAVQQGLITEAEIDVAVKRLFLARFKLGMFDPEQDVSYAQIPYSIVDCDKHKKIALEAAQKSIVLLKNENNLLPLSRDVKSVAVIGPNANDADTLLANYNGYPADPVTPLRGIQEKIGADKVSFAYGCSWAKELPLMEIIPSLALFTKENGTVVNGLKAEYFNNRDLSGEPVFCRIDKELDFTWWEKAPADNLNADGFSIRWTGKLVAPDSGRYAIGANGMSGYRIYLQDDLHVDYESPDEAVTQYEYIDLQKGQEYKLEIEFYKTNGTSKFQLLWEQPNVDLQNQALDIAAKSDVVVMFMGLSRRLEGEEMKVKVPGFDNGDRVEIALPAVQDELMKKINALGKPVVLVLLNGSAVSFNWAADTVPAIVEAWYPGQAAGQAIADVLFGDYNPGGRLPVTFYKSVNQLPPFHDYNMQGKTYRFFREEPLYPFGYGLSYTNFKYSNLQMPKTVKSGENVRVSVDVENGGQRAGDEVVQLYVTDVKATVPVPICSLQGFKRISLEPGQKQTVEFVLTPRQVSVVDDDGNFVVEPGEFEIFVGGKQPGFIGRCDAETTQVISQVIEIS